MRILHVISAPAAGGAEVYVKDLAKEMVRRGHEVVIGFLSHACDVGRDVEYEVRYLRELDDHNVEYFFIGNNSRRKIWLGVFGIRSFVNVNKIDIYHSHLKYGVLFGFFLSIPRIYTHHNIVMGVGRWWAKLSNKGVDAYVGISKICSRKMISFFTKEVVTILNGVDLKRLEGAVFARKLDCEKINLIAVGGIQVQKNYKLMIDAMVLLSDDLKEKCTLRIVGEGCAIYTEEIRKYIELKGVGSWVKLLGNRDDVPALLADSSLFVMSSSWEGLPISLIEATMAGLPCVATDVGGCSEIIERCNNGIVVPPESAEKLANAIAKILSSSDYFADCSCEAINNSHYFSLENSVRDHLVLYQKLM